MSVEELEFELEQEIAVLGLVDVGDIAAINDLANLLLILDDRPPQPRGFDFLSSRDNSHTLLFQKAAVAYNFTKQSRI